MPSLVLAPCATVCDAVVVAVIFAAVQMVNVAVAVIPAVVQMVNVAVAVIPAVVQMVKVVVVSFAAVLTVQVAAAAPPPAGLCVDHSVMSENSFAALQLSLLALCVMACGVTVAAAKLAAAVA
jgi:hypothetical protein